MALPVVPGLIEPAAATDGALSFVSRQIFDTLVQYREGSSDIEPGLAVQWFPSRDGLSWSFRLRDGVRFHDGTLLTPHHVADSLERLIVAGHPFAPSPNAAAPRLLRGSPGVIKDIRVVDQRTIRISLLLPYAPLLTVLAHPAFSIVLPGGSAGQRWLGTGPFSVAETGTGRLVLDANPGYWGGAPKVARVIFLDASDEGRAEAALDSQGLDILVPSTPPTRLAGALSIPGWRVGYLALQTEKEPLNKVKVRRALAAALDPAQLAAALGQVAAPLQAFLPPGVWGRREGPPLLEANAEAAKRLLSEAGFARGTAAALLVAEGSRRLDTGRIAEVLRASLAAAGITVPIQLDSPDGALALAQNGDHEIALLEARVEGGDPHFLLYPLSSSEGAIKGPGALNMSFYRNARLDDLLIRGSQLSFRPERQRLYVRAQAMLAEEMPWIPLYVRLHWAVVRPEVKNFRLHPSGNHRLDRVWLEVQAGAPPLGLPPLGR
ncbi:MAG TPA: ABC transporter substrate-binding protein [Methylomirabilota bacterium]|nr:ABC transporter substrate-binding protein [Methylomirabilota bacterium]